MKEKISLLLKKATFLGHVESYDEIIAEKAKKNKKKYPHKPISRCYEIKES